MVDIKRIIRQNKEGIIIGAIVGYLFGKFFLNDIDVSSIIQTQSVIDSLISAGKSSVELAKSKVVLATTLLGAVMGFIVDSQLKEGFFRRWL